MHRHLSIFLAALILLETSQHAAAERIYCSISTQRQGVINGDRGLGGDATMIPISGFSEEVISPRDPLTGQATGRLQHKPIVLLKSPDRASPQLLMAATSNENLSSVRCLFYRSLRPGNTATAYFRIVLTNASIVDLKIVGDRNSNDSERESVSLIYQRIELTDINSNTTVTDDWNTER